MGECVFVGIRAGETFACVIIFINGQNVPNNHICDRNRKEYPSIWFETSKSEIFA